MNKKCCKCNEIKHIFAVHYGKDYCSRCYVDTVRKDISFAKGKHLMSKGS